MKKAGKRKVGMAVQIIGVVVTLLALFGILIGVIGYVSFSNAIKAEYAVTTYHMADTAATLVIGDHLIDYLEGRETEEYARTKKQLDRFCNKMSVSLVYVIVVDTMDYGRFVSVFNAVNNSVDHSNYTEWELGHPRNTTNDEYRLKYREMYDQTAFYGTVYRMNPSDGSHPHITTMVPVKDMYNNTTGILCIQRPLSELRAMTRPYLIIVAVSTAVLALGIALFIALYIRRKFVKPVRMVSEEAARFAKDNEKGEPLEGISNLKEIHDLAVSVDKMESDMVRYIGNLTRMTADKERLSVELSLAAAIQEAFVPSEFPAFPDRTEFDIFATMDPAREVGGDFYNFLMVDDDHLAFVIGDVSGKGIPAALFMMVTNLLVMNGMQQGYTPAEVLASVNNNLCIRNTMEMFVTVWLGVLELSTGKLTASNAGHEYPAFQKDGQFSYYKDKHGFVLGAMENMKYKDYEVLMSPGDKVFVYTDGATEATSPEQKLFGTDRLLQALNREPGAKPRKVLENVLEEVDGFVSSAEQFDDLTMLCLEYKGKGVDQA